MNDLVAFPPGQNVEWMKNERRFPESRRVFSVRNWKRRKERVEKKDRNNRGTGSREGLGEISQVRWRRV